MPLGRRELNPGQMKNMDDTMTKDNEHTTDRVAALEQEVETTFREVCRAIGGDWVARRLSDDLRKLHQEAMGEANQVKNEGWMVDMAQKHHAEVQKVAAEVAALRKRAGAAVQSFKKKFEKVKGHLDEEALSSAAIKVRGVLHCGSGNLYRFVLHLLVTPGLLAGAQNAAASQYREDEQMGFIGYGVGQEDPGYWPRVDAMMDVVDAPPLCQDSCRRSPSGTFKRSGTT